MVNAIHNIFVNFKTDVRGFQNGINAVRNGLNMSKRDINQMAASTNRAGMKFANFGRQFQMWALSIMFFSMAMRKAFMGLATAGVRSFTKVMEASGFFGSAIQRLAVHWEFLKFTIGSALNRVLEPLIGIIIPIINAITNWIQKHPALTAAIIAGGLALATFLGIIAQLGLLLPAFAAMLSGPLGIVPALVILAGLTFTGLGTLLLLTGLEKNQEAAVKLKDAVSDTIELAKDGFKELISVLDDVVESFGLAGVSGALDFFQKLTILAANIAVNRFQKWILEIRASIQFMKALYFYILAIAQVLNGDFSKAATNFSKGFEGTQKGYELFGQSGQRDVELAQIVTDAMKLMNTSNPGDITGVGTGSPLPMNVQNMYIQADSTEKILTEVQTQSILYGG